MSTKRRKRPQAQDVALKYTVAALKVSGEFMQHADILDALYGDEEKLTKDEAREAIAAFCERRVG